MKRYARYALALVAVLGAGTVACSAILGIDPPPAPDAGASDASAGGDVPIALPDVGAPEVAAPVCMPLDAGDGSIGYVALSPIDTSATGNWDFFSQVDPGHNPIFAGGTFDGRYVYFAGRGNYAARYDTQGSSFEDPTAWSYFTITGLTPAVPGAFAGAAFDGRFVYFVPSITGATHESVVARYDTQGPFTVIGSWSSFDMSTLSVDAGGDAGPFLGGFSGAGFDGRFLYFVPRNDGVAFGKVVRFDTTLPDAGDPPDSGVDAADAEADGATDAEADSATDAEADSGTDAGHDAGASDAGARDAGDAGDAGPEDSGAPDAGNPVDAGTDAEVSAFANAALWSTFDLTTLPAALPAPNGSSAATTGFYGAVFDGTYVYLVPQANGIFANELHGGGSSIVARYHADASFTTSASWTLFDSQHRERARRQLRRRWLRRPIRVPGAARVQHRRAARHAGRRLQHHGPVGDL